VEEIRKVVKGINDKIEVERLLAESLNTEIKEWRKNNANIPVSAS
jgi:hypothetical protein